jgi:hypothetical protein
MWAGPDEAEPARRELRAEGAAGVEGQEARVELPSVADARFAVALEARQPDSSHTQVPAEGVRCERALAAGAGAAAAPALQPPVAMRAAGQVKEGTQAAEAASRSRFEFAWAADSTRAAAATQYGRFPEQRVGKRADSPRAVWPFPHNGDTRSSMAEHRGRTVGTPS